MKILKLGKLRRLANRLQNQFAPGGLILLYHRIAEVPSDPFKLCVTPHHFAEQLEVLKKNSHPVSLQKMLKALKDGQSINRWVAITFDDGYTDNFYNAKPLLEKHDIPATIFVATGNLENQRVFWWDELERLLQPSRLPKTLCLKINGNIYEWDLGEAEYYTEETFQRNHAWNWYVAQEADPSPRQRLYRELYQRLQSVSVHERKQLLNQLIEWSGIDSSPRSTHRVLSPQEVYTMQQDSLIEVGAHTVNHPFLSKLPINQQRHEIEQSKVYLEELIKRPLKSFSYPHGNYTTKTVQIVRELGFAYACSTVTSKVRKSSDFLQLPRVEVKDWDGEEFTKQLNEWLNFI